jgi:hypothetical protein
MWSALRLGKIQMINLESISPDLLSDLAYILMISLESTSPDLLSDLAKYLSFQWVLNIFPLLLNLFPNMLPI